MNRTNWTFSYPANVLGEAAEVKRVHHLQRLKWWEDKKDEVVSNIKSEGIEVDESLADMVSNSYSRGATVNIRDDLLRDLQECISKVREHRGKAADYAAWIEILQSQGQVQLLLHHDDWQFFFSKLN